MELIMVWGGLSLPDPMLIWGQYEYAILPDFLYARL